MDEQAIIRVDQTVRKWLHADYDLMQKMMHKDLEVSEKTGPRDLVTNVDKASERFLIEKIRTFDPDAKILGEEGFGDCLTSMDGNVWIVDPLDGTMNFVKQRDHFAIMIALYQDGKGVLGYIFDVMNDVLYAGGPAVGVYANDERLTAPNNIPLSEGLFGASGPLVIGNISGMQEIIRHSRGMRIYGSAGIEFIHAFLGKTVGYSSFLKPWDFAAGRILAETLGLVVTKIDGSPLDMLSSNLVLVTTGKAQQDIRTIVNENV
ncbi:inositol monophosphatase family protein [Secundilactobacillus oryzae JCM 18671]|uniref:Inositol monophosphatase family protein n=1 Tax=Secundilactobacillus oryzae JCM 18671 TaxID=1291743 RepID=A0A081BGR9_9LACO|nr:inositol monophosphatase family protein [Secundilactobacillus oryzae]GAK47237.1 inositol monophosphatase family protein [Secundilactobacillus oryzae JCM 18671]